MRFRMLSATLLLSLLVPIGLRAQGTTGQITGVVRSDLGQPLAGVAVSVKGTSLTSTTTESGRYLILNVPAGQHTLVTSTLGFGTKELPVTVAAGTPSVVDVQLEVRAIQLDQVVATGYAQQRRDQVTGAVAVVTSEEFVKGPARDAAALIAGKMPGLAVIQPSGNPTATAQIALRGRTTINSSSNPLVLIDGIPGGLQTVAAEDIESITVLKDGSAAAIYGTRAQNGVILITTKRYTGGAPMLRYDGYISQSRLYKRPDFLTASDYRRLIDEGYSFEDYGSSTDWLDAVLRQPVSYRHNLSLSGGALNTNYTASLNLENEQGIFNRSDNNELTARANIRHSMFDSRLEVEATVLSRVQKNFYGPNFDYSWRQALIRNPTDRVMDDAGNWQEQVGYFYVNPVALIEEENGEDENRQTRLHGGVTFRPFSQLSLTARGGTTRSNRLRGDATTFRHSGNTQGNDRGTANRRAESGVDRILELTGTLTNRFGDHSVTLLGGYGYQDELDEIFTASNSRFPTDVFGWDQLSEGTGIRDGVTGLPESGKRDSKLIGFFGRVNYDWKNRYILMASVRHEGSSKFGADHKWGTFPAVAASWRITEESFMDRVGFLDDLRLRVGYGVTGIAPDSSYRSLTSYSYGARIFYNGEWVQGLSPSRNPNPDLRWEEKSETNIGVNFSALDYRLNGAVDVYRRDTRDMLFGYSVPVPPNLTGTITANVGTMRNTGVEAELSYDVIKRPRFSWTTSANWSTNSNKLKSLSNETYAPQSDCRFDGGTGEPIQQSTHRNCVGDPIGNFYGYKSIDIDENGVWIVERPAQYDEDGNLVKPDTAISIRDATAADRQVLGNGLPKQYFAWNNTAQIGNFDLSVNMRGAAGFQILDYLRMYYENPRITQYNMLRSAFEPVYGKKREDGSPVLVNHDLSYVSYYIEDGDYIKLDNATIGYTFNQGQLGRLSRVLTGARIYLSGRNLLTITGYKGLDPEVNTNGLAPGQESRDAYPTIRRFTAGLTFSL
jgi:TonB-dependent starch-binding outer membrane protein SusC